MSGAFDHSPSASGFDPFGEPVDDSVARDCSSSAAGDRMARRIGGAVFWTLALAILAGRIYAADLPMAQTAAAYGTQLLALR